MNSNHYLGCYRDNQTRALQVRRNFDNNSLETCTTYCGVKGKFGKVEVTCRTLQNEYSEKMRIQRKIV